MWQATLPDRSNDGTDATRIRTAVRTGHGRYRDGDPAGGARLTGVGGRAQPVDLGDRYTPAWLEALEFKATPAVAEILEGVNTLRDMNRRQLRKVPDTAPTGFIRNASTP